MGRSRDAQHLREERKWYDLAFIPWCKCSMAVNPSGWTKLQNLWNEQGVGNAILTKMPAAQNRKSEFWATLGESCSKLLSMLSQPVPARFSPAYSLTRCAECTFGISGILLGWLVKFSRNICKESLDVPTPIGIRRVILEYNFQKILESALLAVGSLQKMLSMLLF